MLKARLKYSNATHIVVTKARLFKDVLLPNFEKRRGKRSITTKNDLVIRLSDSVESRCYCPELTANRTLKRKELKLNVNFLIMITNDDSTNNGKSKEVFQLKQTQNVGYIAQLIMPWRPNDKVKKNLVLKQN